MSTVYKIKKIARHWRDKINYVFRYSDIQYLKVAITPPPVSRTALCLA